MKTVMITGAGGPAGRSLLGQLSGCAFADEPVFVIGADMREVPGGDAPLTLCVPSASSPDFLSTLHHIMAYFEVDLLVPTVSEELPVIAVAAPLLADTIPPLLAHGVDDASAVERSAAHRISIGTPSAVAIAADKLSTMQALRREGVPAPAFADATEFRSAASALRVLGGPVVMKPRVSRGARGVRVIRGDDDVPWETAGQVLQRFAPGAEYCVQVHRPASPAAHPVAVALRKTTLTGGDIGNATGAVRDATAQDVREVALAAVEALELTGPADVDVRRDERGLPVVLEVNARFGAQSHHAPEVLASVLVDAGVG